MKERSTDTLYERKRYTLDKRKDQLTHNTKGKYIHYMKEKIN